MGEGKNIVMVRLQGSRPGPLMAGHPFELAWVGGADHSPATPGCAGSPERQGLGCRAGSPKTSGLENASPTAFAQVGQTGRGGRGAGSSRGLRGRKHGAEPAEVLVEPLGPNRAPSEFRDMLVLTNSRRGPVGGSKELSRCHRCREVEEGPGGRHRPGAQARGSEPHFQVHATFLSGPPLTASNLLLKRVCSVSCTSINTRILYVCFNAAPRISRPDDRTGLLSGYPERRCQASVGSCPCRILRLTQGCHRSCSCHPPGPSVNTREFYEPVAKLLLA